MEKYYTIDDAIELGLNKKDFAWLAIAQSILIDGVYVDYVNNKPFIMTKSIIEILRGIGLYQAYKDLLSDYDEYLRDERDRGREEREERDNMKWSGYDDAFEGDSSNYWNID